VADPDYSPNSWGPIIGLLLPEKTLNGLASFTNLEGRMVLEDVGTAKKAASLTFDEFEKALLPELREKFENDSKTAYRLDQAYPPAYYYGATSIMEEVSKGTLPEKFTNLPFPKLYVYGDENEHLKSIESVSGIPTIAIRNAGHFMMKDNPEEFYMKLDQFIAEDNN